MIKRFFKACEDCEDGLQYVNTNGDDGRLATCNTCEGACEVETECDSCSGDRELECGCYGGDTREGRVHGPCHGRGVVPCPTCCEPEPEREVA